MVKFYAKKKTVGFHIPLPEVESVALLGDFNDWNETAHMMKKNKKGVWRVELKLPEGEHQFRYFVDGNRWANDDELPTTLNDFGSLNSVVTIKY